MPRALVTGGAGFIGSHVVDRFLANGFEVDVIDDLSTGKRTNVAAQALLRVIDVRSPETRALIGEGRFDVIVHLAAQMDVRRSVADPIHDASINILGTLSLIEAARGLPRTARPRVVFASTGGALYGDYTTPPNVETFAKDPDSPYAISKLAAELYLAYYGRVHGLHTIALRLGNVFGPRQDPHGEAGVVAIFCGRLLEGKPLTVFGDGRQTRDYVYVDDVVDAIVLAATAKMPDAGRLDSRAFNVGTGVGTSVLRIAEALSAAAGVAAHVQFAPARPGEQLRSFVAIDKIGDALGWRPRTSLETGLALTYAWFAEGHVGERTSLSRV